MRMNTRNSSHRHYSQLKRGYSYDEYPDHSLSRIEIGTSDYYRDVWDYSEGDLLLYDTWMIPKEGDIVLTKDREGVYRVKLYQPVSHKLKVGRQEFAEDGTPLPSEPEIVEVIDKSIIGVVMFDIRRRSMPAKI